PSGSGVSRADSRIASGRLPRASSILLVEIGLHFLVGRSPGWNSAFRDFDAGDPGNGVQHHTAMIVMLPVAVEMPAGETEGSALADRSRAFVSPHDVLGFLALEDRLADVGVACTRVVGTAQTFFRWKIREDRGDALHVVTEAHVIVPLVSDVEVVDPASHGMLGKFERGVPVRIDRPVQLEVA